MCVPVWFEGDLRLSVCMLTTICSVNELMIISAMTSLSIGSHEAGPELILEVLTIPGKLHSGQ